MRSALGIKHAYVYVVTGLTFLNPTIETDSSSFFLTLQSQHQQKHLERSQFVSREGRNYCTYPEPS